MQKVIFLVNSLSTGGGEKIVSTLANEFAKEFQTEIIIFENDISYNINKPIDITFLGTKFGIYNNILKFLLIPILAWKLKKYVSVNNIEVINSHLYRANYINTLAKVFGSTHKAVIVNHGDPFQYYDKGILGKINLFLLKNLYPYADVVVSISDIMESRLLSISPKSKVQVINNPYDIKNILKLSYEKVSFEFKINKKYLICMGRLIKLKRFEDIINTLNLLSEDVELIILGDGIEKKKLIEEVNKLELTDRVHFIGNVKNPFAYLRNADIFILSSKSEGFPNSIIEAMVCGLPIISSDCISGPREILSPEKNHNIVLEKSIEISKYGILYPVGSVEGLVESIRILFNNDNLKNEYIAKGIIRARDFSIEKILVKYKEILVHE
jgi:glycosyltransferase involved in cell wall biosynthesis